MGPCRIGTADIGHTADFRDGGAGAVTRPPKGWPGFKTFLDGVEVALDFAQRLLQVLGGIGAVLGFLLGVLFHFHPLRLHLFFHLAPLHFHLLLHLAFLHLVVLVKSLGAFGRFLLQRGREVGLAGLAQVMGRGIQMVKPHLVAMHLGHARSAVA